MKAKKLKNRVTKQIESKFDLNIMSIIELIKLLVLELVHHYKK